MTDGSSTSVLQPRTDEVLTLSDGRTLGYAEYGPPDGDSLLFFHGTPQSRYTRVPDASLLADHGIRQITLERPGFGRSTYDDERAILDWPADVREATAMLGVDDFAVVGVSGGAPFVLACGARLSDRVTGAGVVGGVGPLDAPNATEGMELANRIGFKLAHVPFLLWPLVWLRIRKIRADPEGFLDDWAAGAADADAAILQRPAVRAVFAQNFLEAVRQGPKAPLHETRLHAWPWGFDLGDVPVHVDLWHGGCDTFAPEPMARHVADALPASALHFYKEK